MNVLSCDGGGARAVYQLGALDAIWGLEPVTSGCDLFIGTSAGGIDCCAFALGHKPWDVAQLYITRSKDIFTASAWYRFKTQYGLGGPKYPLDGLRNVLTDFFGNTKIVEAKQRVMTTAYDTKTATIILPDSANEKWSDWTMVEACLATAAAPTYFPSSQPLFPAFSKENMNLVDGGVFAGSPALVGYNEMKKTRMETRKSDPSSFHLGSLLSVGTGYKTHTYDTGGFGTLEWIIKKPFGKTQTPLTDIFQQAAKQLAHYTVNLDDQEEILFTTIDRELTAMVSMDETDPGLLTELFYMGQEDGEDYLKGRDTKMEIPEKPVTNKNVTGEIQLSL